MVTKAEFLFMIQLVHIPSHTVHTAAHCNSLQPAANHPVHIPSHLVHTAANIQCTLQLYYLVHTAANLQCTHSAATLFGSNTIQYIQCTFEPPQGKPIPLLAYLQDSQLTLMVDYSSPYDEEDWLIVAVH